jgi:hypothetical protein
MKGHHLSALSYDWRILLILIAIYLVLYAAINYLIFMKLGMPEFDQHTASFLHRYGAHLV